MTSVSERRVWLFCVTVFAAGATLVAWALPEVDRDTAAWFIVAAALTELLPVRMRRQVFTSLLSTVCLTALVYGGLPLALTATVGVPLVAWRFYDDRRLQRWLFNTGQMTVAVGAAGTVFALVGGRAGAPALPRSWVALLAAAVAFTAVNHLLIAVVIRVSSGERIRSTMRSLLGSAISAQLGHAGLAVLAAVLLVHAGPASIAFLVVPALIARFGLLGYQREAEAYDRLVNALLKAIEVKDGYTAGHTERVSTLCVEVARALGFGYDDLRAVEYAARLHDVGKLAVPTSIINKPAALDDDEFALIRDHPVVGVEILAGIDFLRPALDGVRYHHERVDGRGYPFGIAGDRIPLLARIITVCDAFDAMTTTRSYRRAMPLPDAFAELERCAGTQFDGEVIDVLRRVVADLGWQPTPEAYSRPNPVAVALSRRRA